MVPAGMGIGLPISKTSMEVIHCKGLQPQSRGADDPQSNFQVAPPKFTYPQAPLISHKSKNLDADGDCSTNALSISSPKFYLLLSILRMIRNFHEHGSNLPVIASVATIRKEPHVPTLKAKQLLLYDFWSQSPLFHQSWLRRPHLFLLPENCNQSQSQGLKPAPQPPLCTLPPIPREKNGFLVSHMVQVFSVAIHPQFDDGRPCEIYGQIAVEDDDGNVFIYSQERNVAEVIPSCGGNLSLIEDEKGNLISCRVDSASMFLSLRDKVRDVTLFDEREVTLHSEDEDIEESCDKLMKTIVQGDHGYACIYYATFIHAVTAHVRISIVQRDDTPDVDCSHIDVHGSVVARYGNAERFCNSDGDDDQVEHMKSTLFDKPSDKCLKVKIGSCINLTRYLMAVPAYSSLIIEANLMYSDGQVARGSAEFLADCSYWVTQIIRGESFDIVVQVRWGDNYRLSDNHDSVFAGYTSAFRKAFLGPNAKERHGATISAAKFDSLINEGRLFGATRGEVFSVYVAGMNHNVSSICGQIRVNDYNQWNMFDRSPEDPHILTTDKMIATLECHDEIESNDFQIEVCLKDPINDLEVSKGLIVWNKRRLCDIDGNYSLHDRALCSIVHGSDGYAVVHYMIYLDACRATVEISIFHNNPSMMDPINVCGSVTASNSNFNYATPYLKKYFLSRLFDKPPAEAIQLTSHSKIPLSKSVMAVSTFACLVIEVQLKAMSMDNQIIDALCGEEELEIDLDNISCTEFRGEHYRAELSVKFERFEPV